jgi:hypothetical protein
VTTALMYLSIIVGLVVVLLRLTPTVPTAFRVALGPTEAILLSALQGTVVFFYLKGRNWARWLVITASVWQLMLLVGVRHTWQASPACSYLLIAYAALALYLLVYLISSQGRQYFTTSVA